MKGSIATRFWAKVNKHGPVHPRIGTRCWEWTAATTAGYGNMGVGKKRAHRIAWFLKTDTWPTEDVLHRCDIPHV